MKTPRIEVRRTAAGAVREVLYNGQLLDWVTDVHVLYDHPRTRSP